MNIDQAYYCLAGILDVFDEEIERVEVFDSDNQMKVYLKSGDCRIVAGSFCKNFARTKVADA